jgi:hypothetical protein
MMKSIQHGAEPNAARVQRMILHHSSEAAPLVGDVAALTIKAVSVREVACADRLAKLF